MSVAFYLLSVLSIPSPGTPLPVTSGPPISRPSSLELREATGGTSLVPDLRTTQGIIWSCIATIFACTWIAIHPNLPNHKDTKWQQLKKRVGVMAVALAAPEFILLWALKQRVAARIIMDKYNLQCLSAFSSDQTCTTPSVCFRPRPHKPHRWTLAHGFFMQMGGLLLTTGDPGCPICVLDLPTLKGLIKKARIGAVNISERDISDRSKGDSLAKLLVVVQTSWFMAQCGARWATKLTVTEIEVVTFSFAVLNMITYALWWDKPQNVNEPVAIPLKKPTAPPILPTTPAAPTGPDLRVQAWEPWLLDHPHQVLSHDLPLLFPPLFPFERYHNGVEEFAFGSCDGSWPLSTLCEVDITDAYQFPLNHHANELNPPPSGDQARPCSPQFPHTTSPALPSLSGRRSPYQRSMGRSYTQRRGIPYRLYQLLRRFFQGIWKARLYLFIGDIITRELLLRDQDIISTQVAPSSFRNNSLEGVIRTRNIEGGYRGIVCHLQGNCAVGLFHASDVESIAHKIGLIVFVAMTGILFGGLHLPANWSPFPTQTEAIIWRIAVLYTMVNPLLLAAPLAILVIVRSRRPDLLPSFVRRPLLLWRGRIFSKIFRAIALILPLYVVARIAIIIVACTTLRNLPSDALKDVPWSSFIPHL